jgi:FkbM family methyltransferase
LGPSRLITRLKRLQRRYRNWRDPLWVNGWGTFDLAGERLLFKEDYGAMEWWGDAVRRGRYEPVALEAFAGAIKRGDVVLDVGAWIGPYALVASRRAGPEGRVFAFEPNPASRALLEANVERNEMTNVTVVPHAVSDRPGPAWLRLRRILSDMETATDRGGGDLEVEAVTLVSFCTAHNIAPDMIKIDAEGAEAEALPDEAAQIVCGARATLIEIHDDKLRDRGVEPTRFLDRITGWGIELTELERRSPHNYTVVLVPSSHRDSLNSAIASPDSPATE